MESTPTAADVVRKVLILSLFGFLAIVLAGPLIAVASVMLSLILSLGVVLLPFFVVGVLLWLPFQALILGKQIQWGKVGTSAKVLFGGLFTVFSRVFGGSFRLVRGLGYRLWTATRFVSFVMFDAVGGALIGGLLGGIGGAMHGDAEGRIPIGAAIGAVVGVIFSLSRSRQQEKDVVVAQVVEPEKPRDRSRVVVEGLKGCVEVAVK